MPCNLQTDPTFAFDFVAKTGSSSILFVESDAATAVIEAADLDGTDLPPDANGKITAPKLTAGIRILSITVNGAVAGDQVRFKEDCGDGTTQVRKTFTFDGEPLKRYQINVS